MSQEAAPPTTLVEVQFLPEARHVRLALLHIYTLNLGGIVQNHTLIHREVRMQSDGMKGEAQDSYCMFSGIKPGVFLSFTFVCLLQLFIYCHIVQYDPSEVLSKIHSDCATPDLNFWSWLTALTWPILCHQSITYWQIKAHRPVMQAGATKLVGCSLCTDQGLVPNGIVSPMWSSTKTALCNMDCWVIVHYIVCTSTVYVKWCIECA